MATDHELRVHRDWIGLLQPVGLVVSPPALLAAQAFPDKNILKEQQALLAAITPPPTREGETVTAGRPLLPLAFETLATEVLGWKASKLAGGTSGPPLPDILEIVLPDLGETLRPTYAVPAVPGDDAEWMMLVQELPDGTSFDEPPAEGTRPWHASPQSRLERLLWETGVPIGILTNGRFVRLVYRPRGESSGHVTWPVHRLCTALDRGMLSAMCMLLGASRLFALPREQRLPHILKESRKYQSVVSTKLAGQVLEALNELLRGFQSANGVAAAANGSLLDETVREDPDHIYGGLLAVLLRLVFILYAEERGLVSSSAAYVRNYALVGLFDKLRADAGRFPDTMDERYGAWSRLLVLFRMVHDGAKRGDLRLPPRYGHLFDPDGWSFLEGRAYRVNRVMGAPVAVPKVADGVVLRVLEKLLLLDADRLSYRALDVEQIGSVYENMMGFRLERAMETSIGVGKHHVVIGLEALLAKKGAEREKHLKETANVELSGKAAEALVKAKSLADLVAAMNRRISPLTPRPVPAGGLYLQPTDERRRSGSHYTPRELTEPIVRTTLRPVLKALGPSPSPAQILDLKVCDPAMGSGAFLVETCRQLAEALVEAWETHRSLPSLAPDEDPLLHAQRVVAQRCLYGVDKNPFAVTLAKLSLWLVTLAKDHSFTFLDHALKHGDSIVGLTKVQLGAFHWDPPENDYGPLFKGITAEVGKITGWREQIQSALAGDYDGRRMAWQEAEDVVHDVRLLGDLCIAAYFGAEKDKDRELLRRTYLDRAGAWKNDASAASRAEIVDIVAKLRGGERPVWPLHWEIEFPEVFGRGNPGFDAMVGNPPFLGGKRISTVSGDGYRDWLAQQHVGANSNADLVAHFYRRAFSLIRSRGTFGLIATNTIAQGDTRSSGLRWICTNDGAVYDATRRLKWPGRAAVVVSVVQMIRGRWEGACRLDGRDVPSISAFLFAEGGHDDPHRLPTNEGKSFIGSIVLGMGFTFDDTDKNGSASSLSEMHRLVAKDVRNAARIFPYMGGEEVNSSPTHEHHRYVINFGEMSEEDARRWPDLMAIVEAKVKPERVGKPGSYSAQWWLFGRRNQAGNLALTGLQRVLVVARTTKYLGFAFLPAGIVYSENTVVFPFQQVGVFALLQSSVHDLWVRLFTSTLEDRLGYRPSDCFETFPFPSNWQADPVLEVAGQRYYDFRAALMVRNNEGLTKTYNRFHDPDETDPDLLQLRDLHAAMDRAVLDAYGWTDLQPTCEFLLDYEEEDDEAESAGKRRKKKPWRFRWPDDVRDEVLARLLELNAQRARGHEGSAPRVAVAAPEEPVEKKPRARVKGAKKVPAGQEKLFGGKG